MQEGKVNYFIGNDPKKWRTNIPTYTSVRYKEIYKGIDIKFYGNNNQMEYDIIVKPGGDPNDVKLAYEGIEGLKVTKEGNLEIALKQGKIIQKKPVIYQEINGEKVAVDGKFKIQDVIARSAGDEAIPSVEIASPLARNDSQNSQPTTFDPRQFTYTFEVASYYKSHDLIIDPVIVWSTYLGGSGNEWARSITVDIDGNVYITGKTNSTDFPMVSAIQSANAGAGYWEVFITKINAKGNGIVYSTYLGGSGSDEGSSIAIDASGNAYVTGATSSFDFPIVHPIQGSNAGGTFISKINAEGNALVYSTYLGVGGDEGRGIAVDVFGNAYVVGTTGSTDFPVVFPIFLTNRGGVDAFVAKINSTGGSLVYSTYLGGSGNDIGQGITVDTTGNVYIVGYTDSTDFPTTSPIQEINKGGSDIFVTKINAEGSSLVYSTYLGGSGTDIGTGIAADTHGNAYVTGYTTSTEFPMVFPVQGTYASGGDAFVAKINLEGSNLVYSTYLGGSTFDGGFSIALDTSENAYITGKTNSTDFPMVSPIYGTQFGGGDAFVAKIGEQPLPSTPTQSQGKGSGTNNQGTSNAPGLKTAPGVQSAPGLQNR